MVVFMLLLELDKMSYVCYQADIYLRVIKCHSSCKNLFLEYSGRPTNTTESSNQYICICFDRLIEFNEYTFVCSLYTIKMAFSIHTLHNGPAIFFALLNLRTEQFMKNCTLKFGI